MVERVIRNAPRASCGQTAPPAEHSEIQKNALTEQRPPPALPEGIWSAPRFQLQAGVGFALLRGFMQLDIPEGDFAGYLFDLDGTLVDTMPLHFVAWRQALWQCGLERDLDEDFFYSLGGVPTLLVAQRIGEHYGVQTRCRTGGARERGILSRASAGRETDPARGGIRRRVAKAHPLAIVTGGMPEVAQATLESAGLSALFPIV